MILAITGPTASGKTDIAVEAASRLGAEIISADSRQFYRFMDIGTAKPSLSVQESIQHHFIDCADPDQPLSAGSFARRAVKVIDKLKNAGTPVLVTGGSGLYLHGLTYQFTTAQAPNSVKRGQIRRKLETQKPEEIRKHLLQKYPGALSRIDEADTRRLSRLLEVAESEKDQKLPGLEALPRRFEIFDVVVMRDRDDLNNRINERVDIMISNGLRDETLDLIKRGFGQVRIVKETIGYKEMLQQINGGLSLEEAISRIKLHTKQYSKRQLTWFRKYGGVPIDVPEQESPGLTAERIIEMYHKAELNQNEPSSSELSE